MLFRSKRSPHGDQDVVIDVSEEFGIRKLHFGQDDTQSAMRVADPLELVLAYTRCAFGLLLFVEPPREMVLIGLGGGSIAKWVHHKLPQTRLTCVELHSQVVNVARSMFHLPQDDERLSVQVADGTAHVYAMPPGATDVIMMDAYSSTGIVPSLISSDFLTACRDRLTENGVLAINLWSSDKRFPDYRNRLSGVFDGRVVCLPARQKGNVMAFAFNRPQNNPQWERLRERARELEAAYQLEFGEFVADLARMNPHNDRRLFV
ncbi:polyamine aminopropyltransferase [Chitiniphilus shinanonensis]|uniref:Polyamine aminopropyltransferase n=1 Tax=Chitiniphilus shinanonensis TaxID=553088 RepID=A0ABQ6BR80_9NEIS|nr:fused MFS/spermidine synthase [Chitiniphilus shinanonensis]GLS03979.1 polyamine aminopropyltransferase [Chitiniphilus shinanonensis]